MRRRQDNGSPVRIADQACFLSHERAVFVGRGGILEPLRGLWRVQLSHVLLPVDHFIVVVPPGTVVVLSHLRGRNLEG